MKDGFKRHVNRRHSGGKRTAVTSVQIGLVQMRACIDPRKNLEKAIGFIGTAAKQGARLICLQELFRSRYFPQWEDDRNFRLAETIPGPTTKIMCRIAKTKKVCLVVPIFEKRAGGIYHNSAVLIDTAGRLAGHYRKMHIPHDPAFFEKFYFSPGDLGFQTFEMPEAKVAVLICWDQWFPEAARIASLSGAQILFYPTAIGWHVKEGPDDRLASLSAWETIQRAHGIANGVFVAVVNRVGVESKLCFWGSSFVCDPFGRVVAKARTMEETVLIAECNLSKIEETRRDWPFLRDRRIDAYAGLDRRFID